MSDVTDERVTYLQPERKIIAGAIALLIVGLVQQFTGIELFIGAEGAITIIIAYLVPNPTRRRHADPPTP